MKRGKGNVFGGIFINYGELYDSYMIITNILKTISLEEQQTHFKEKHIRGDDFPTFTQGSK